MKKSWNFFSEVSGISVHLSLIIWEIFSFIITVDNWSRDNGIRKPDWPFFHCYNLYLGAHARWVCTGRPLVSRLCPISGKKGQSTTPTINRQSHSNTRFTTRYNPQRHLAGHDYTRAWTLAAMSGVGGGGALPFMALMTKQILILTPAALWRCRVRTHKGLWEMSGAWWEIWVYN